MLRNMPLAVALVAVLCAAAAAAEAPVKMKEADVARVVAAAPKVPVDLDLGLRMRLVDFIDCTDPNDPHDMIDRGTSRVITGPAGKYRVTAPHRHAIFAYRWKAAAQDKPHVLVFEYPDDAKREICFFTHESKLSGKRNIDWSLETGVYCGNPLPLTNKMQYHTFFFWPADNWPVAMVANWARSGAPAACSRIWVYQVEGDLPKADITDADPANPRLVGTVYNWSLVPTTGIFGLTNRDTAMEHIVDYHLYRGDNVIAWPVVSNNGWGFRCKIPAWDGGDKSDELDRILAVCERKGLKFIAILNVGHGFTIGGTDNKLDTRTRESLRRYALGLRQGFGQFLDRYAKSPALYAIAFDTQDLSPKYGEGGLDNVRDCFGGLDKFTAFVKERAPQLKVMHFLGGRSIHAQILPDGGEIVGRWQDGNTPWSQHLANDMAALWKSWQRDPAELNAVPGLTTVLNYQSDDHAIFDSYAQNPRAMFYYDLDRSQARSDLVDTRAAMVWNTFFEGYLGLNPANFWYLKVWVAPDFCPAEPHSLAGWTHAMTHRDRNIMLCGAWNQKGGGHEAALRRFARALRALPPVELKAVAVTGNSPVVVRSATWNGATYVSLLNPTPFEASIRAVAEVPTRETTRAAAPGDVTLAPFGLQTFRVDGEGAVAATGTASPEYEKWVSDRVTHYLKLIEQLERVAPTAAVQTAFVTHFGRALTTGVDKHDPRATDEALGFGLTAELELRKQVLQPLVQKVPLVAGAPPVKADPEAWPEAAADIRTTGANIGTHLFFTNQWSGPLDLSARVRLAHDGKRLYFLIAVTDNKLTKKDGLVLKLSPANYLKWLSQGIAEDDRVPYEISLPMNLPVEGQTAESRGANGYTCTTTKVAGGYVAEGSLDMAALNLKSGSRIGWVVQISDDDDTPFLVNDRWARKSVMLIPNEPNFVYWNDARTCGQLVFE